MFPIYIYNFSIQVGRVPNGDVYSLYRQLLEVSFTESASREGGVDDGQHMFKTYLECNLCGVE